jgi:hypothetical protein
VAEDAGALSFVGDQLFVGELFVGVYMTSGRRPRRSWPLGWRTPSSTPESFETPPPEVGAEAEKADAAAADGRFGRSLHCLHAAPRRAVQIQAAWRGRLGRRRAARLRLRAEGVAEWAEWAGLRRPPEAGGGGLAPRRGLLARAAREGRAAGGGSLRAMCGIDANGLRRDAAGGVTVHDAALQVYGV